MTDVARNAREIREGLANVTPGPWAALHDKRRMLPWRVEGDGGRAAVCEVSQAMRGDFAEPKANAAHIARCSPDIIGPICTAAEEAEALREENARLRKALTTLVEAKALSEVRALVAGWNGEGKPDGPYERHRNGLGATLPKTNCGGVYELDDAMQAARALLAGRPS